MPIKVYERMPWKRWSPQLSTLSLSACSLLLATCPPFTTKKKKAVKPKGLKKPRVPSPGCLQKNFTTFFVYHQLSLFSSMGFCNTI
jgi:hypothetical protein